MRNHSTDSAQISSALGELADVYIKSTDSIRSQYARASDLRAFANEMSDGAQNAGDFFSAFLAREQTSAMAMLESYQARLITKHFRETTIKRRLMTIRGFIGFAQERGATLIKNKKGLGMLYSPSPPIAFLTEPEWRKLQEAPSIIQPGLRRLRSVRIARDTALLCLLCEVPMNGGEVGALKVADFSPKECRLRLPRKTTIVDDSASWVQLHPETSDKLFRYLKRIRVQRQSDAPLFQNLDRRPKSADSGLTSDAVLKIVQEYGAYIGYMHLNPRMLRSTAIISALTDAGGNVARAMQRYPHIKQRVWEEHYDCYRHFSGPR